MTKPAEARRPHHSPLPADAAVHGPGPLTLEGVFHEYAPYVAAIGAKILGRDEELEDLMQDVFLEAHRGLHHLREPLAIKGWLARITVRIARRRLQVRRLRRFLWREPATDFEAIVYPGATPEERAHIASLYRRLEELPTEARIAWVLRHVEGASMEEVAKLCECSLSTVRRRILAAESHLSARGVT